MCCEKTSWLRTFMRSRASRRQHCRIHGETDRCYFFSTVSLVAQEDPRWDSLRSSFFSSAAQRQSNLRLAPNHGSAVLVSQTVTHTITETRAQHDRPTAALHELFGAVADLLSRLRNAASVDAAVRIAYHSGLIVFEKGMSLVMELKLLESLRGRKEEVAHGGEPSPFQWLSDDAKAYAYSSGMLLTFLVEDEVPPPPPSENSMKFRVLDLVLQILGWNRAHGVSDPVQEAIAIAGWKLLVEAVPTGHEELIEDAFDAGHHRQSLETGGPSVNWDDLKEELSGNA